MLIWSVLVTMADLSGFDSVVYLSAFGEDLASTWLSGRHMAVGSPNLCIICSISVYRGACDGIAGISSVAVDLKDHVTFTRRQLELQHGQQSVNVLTDVLYCLQGTAWLGHTLHMPC